ncbi:hypothetical protein OG728_38350 (plasmid) [Streptomyces microflavus]|uniref:hypothetical protein n=1 Tax=Streptomyces microflavus TaxID=1919 RepID=UPI002E1381CD|nr:hypothetical protein OG728_38350 [Streptomyces microflavus]
MTTYVHRPRFVPAGTDTSSTTTRTTTTALAVDAPPAVKAGAGSGDAAQDENTPTGVAGMYTVIVFLNASRPFSAYQQGDTLSEYTANGSLLHLTFSASGVTDVDTVAEAAFTVGNGMGRDDSGRAWPSTARSLSVGDILAVTAPDGTVTHLSTERSGFARINAPTAVTLTFPLALILAAAKHTIEARAHITCEEETDPPSHLCMTHTNGTFLASNASGPHPHTVHAYGFGPGHRAPLPATITEEGLFHAVDLLTPTDDTPGLYTTLQHAHADGATRFLITYDPERGTLTTTTD